MNKSFLTATVRNIITANYDKGSGYVMPESKLISLIKETISILEKEPAVLEFDSSFHIVGGDNVTYCCC